MIGVIDRKDAIDRFNKLLDEYGETLISSIDSNVFQDYNDAMMNIDITLRLQVPIYSDQANRITKILAGE